MECPILPLDTHLLSQDMIHDKVGANYSVNTTASQAGNVDFKHLPFQFDTERGPLWRVQIITQQEMEKV